VTVVGVLTAVALVTVDCVVIDGMFSTERVVVSAGVVVTISVFGLVFIEVADMGFVCEVEVIWVPTALFVSTTCALG
jgi:hypothetical protein